MGLLLQEDPAQTLLFHPDRRERPWVARSRHCPACLGVALLNLSLPPPHSIKSPPQLCLGALAWEPPIRAPGVMVRTGPAPAWKRPHVCTTAANSRFARPEQDKGGKQSKPGRHRDEQTNRPFLQASPGACSLDFRACLSLGEREACPRLSPTAQPTYRAGLSLSLSTGIQSLSPQKGNHS